MDTEGGFQGSAPRHEYTGVKTLRRLTTKQINGLEVDGSSSIHVIDGAEVSNILVCGHVVLIRNSSAGTIFEIDDTTGSVECAFWANGAHDQAVLERVQEKNLVRVMGSLKIFNGKKTLNTTSVSLVSTSYLVYHLAGCIYQSLFFHHRIERPAAQAPLARGGRESLGGGAGLPRIQDDVLAVYRGNQGGEGLEISVVVAMLQNQYSESDVRDAVESMVSNAYLYPVDTDTYSLV